MNMNQTTNVNNSPLLVNEHVSTSNTGNYDRLLQILSTDEYESIFHNVSRDEYDRLLQKLSTDEYEKILQIRIEQNKERYYQSILDNIEIDQNAPEKKVCQVCKKDFHFISNKAQMMKLLDEMVDETKPFALEMVRFRQNCYIQGEESITFHEDINECSHCYLYKDRKRQSNKKSKSWISKMKKSMFGERIPIKN